MVSNAHVKPILAVVDVSRPTGFYRENITAGSGPRAGPRQSQVMPRSVRDLDGSRAVQRRLAAMLV